MVAINTKCSFLDRSDAVLVSTFFTGAYCRCPEGDIYLSEVTFSFERTALREGTLLVPNAKPQKSPEGEEDYYTIEGSK
jgi:hypothetical protein